MQVLVLVPVGKQTLHQLLDGCFPLRGVASVGGAEHAGGEEFEDAARAVL